MVLGDQRMMVQLETWKTKADPNIRVEPLEELRGLREPAERGPRNWMAEEEGEGGWAGTSATKETWR